MDRPVLYVNACVRKESRTGRLAEKALALLGQPYEEVRLDEEFLKTRDRLLAEGKVQHPMFDLARQFARAEIIVMAAPYWDLSFPAALKQYLEQVNVVGITFRYSEEGQPVPLCRAKRLIYVTTAGGCYVPEEFGFGYVRALAQSFYGIREVRQVRALGLDVAGADAEAILASAEAQLPSLLI